MVFQLNTMTDGHRHDENPTTKAVMQEVYAAVRETGREVPSIDRYAVAEHLRDEHPDGAGLLPEFMTGSDTTVSEIVREGYLYAFSLADELDGYFGQPEGSSHVTTDYVSNERSFGDVIRLLDERGQLQLAIDRLADIPQVSDPVEVLAYSLATYAKGWLAERLIASSDRFAKGSTAQDQGGMDLYDRERDEWVQVKSVTYYARQSTAKLEADDREFLWYQWDCDGSLIVGYDANEVNAVAANAKGVSKTLIKRTHSSYTYRGRTFRYLWW